MTTATVEVQGLFTAECGLGVEKRLRKLAGVRRMMIAAYYHHHEAFHEWDPGTTTIAAVIGCYLLGAMTLAGFARLAVILGILTTVLLYFKAELGGVARKLERRDQLNSVVKSAGYGVDVTNATHSHRSKVAAAANSRR